MSPSAVEVAEAHRDILFDRLAKSPCPFAELVEFRYAGTRLFVPQLLASHEGGFGKALQLPLYDGRPLFTSELQ